MREDTAAVVLAPRRPARRPRVVEATMSEELQVLILEDRPTDAALLVRALERAGMTMRWTRVQTEHEYLAGLDLAPDIILADYSLPQFDVLRALHHLRARNLDIPLVVVTGTVSEEAAVECIGLGAADYLLKDRLTRLGPAVQRALASKRQRADQRAAERLAQATLDSLPQHIAILDETGVIITVNHAWRGFARQNGFADQHYGVGVNYLMACDTAEGEWADLARATAAGIRAVMQGARADWIGEYPCHSPTEQRWFEARVSRFAEPGPPYLIVSLQSVTERRRNEEALRTSEVRLRTVVSNAPIILWAVDAAGIYTLCEGTQLRTFGHKFGMLVGNSIWDAVQRFPDVAADVRRAFSGEPVVTVVHLHRFVIETHYTLVHDSEGVVTGLIGVGTDVTDRVRIGQEHARMAAIVDSSDDAIISKSLDGTIESWNAGAERMYGYTAREAIGTPIAMLAPPDRVEEAAAILRRVAEGESIAQFETVRIGKHGQTMEVSLAISPIRDAAGTITGAATIAHDVSMRKRALREAEQGRAIAEELAAMRNDFVAATSHELRTPLTAILGYAELLEVRWNKLDDSRRLAQVRQITVSANRQLRLVQALLRLNTLEADVPSPPLRAIPIPPLIQQAVDEVHRSYRTLGIALNGRMDVTAMADPQRALEIVVNMLDNAAKYSPEDSDIEVSWREEGEAVIVRVVDHGQGIPEQAFHYLFTRFGRVPGSRMREGHVGTGLGLYLGRQLARAMDGDLTLETTSPLGSTFRLDLQRVPALP
jgi:PAS domain S-box-containing protein